MDSNILFSVHAAHTASNPTTGRAPSTSPGIKASIDEGDPDDTYERLIAKLFGHDDWSADDADAISAPASASNVNGTSAGTHDDANQGRPLLSTPHVLSRMRPLTQVTSRSEMQVPAQQADTASLCTTWLALDKVMHHSPAQ